MPLNRSFSLIICLMLVSYTYDAYSRRGRASDQVIKFTCVPELNYFGMHAIETSFDKVKDANLYGPEGRSKYDLDYLDYMGEKYHIYPGVRGFAGNFQEVSEECVLQDGTIKVDMKVYNLWGAPCRGITGADITLWFNDLMVFDNVNGFSCAFPSIDKVEYSDQKIYVSVSNIESSLTELLWIMPHNKYPEELKLEKKQVVSEENITCNYLSKTVLPFTDTSFRKIITLKEQYDDLESLDNDVRKIKESKLCEEVELIMPELTNEECKNIPYYYF